MGQTLQQNADGSWSKAEQVGPRIVGWRDVDSERRQFGFRSWAGGAELRVGRRVYRWRVAR